MHNFIEFSSEDKFHHEWFPELQLEQVNTDNGRFYVTPEGNRYQSVTTFLGKSDKEGQAAIRAWKDAVGEAEANAISKRATTRGSTLHDSIENYLLNHTVHIDKRNLLALNLFKSMKPVLNRIQNIRLLEDRLYSDTLKLAGTIDCCGEWDGKLSVIDFKTSNHRKDKEEIDSYFLQCTIYSLMIEELFKVKIDQLVILMAVEFEKPVIHIDSRKNRLKPLAKLVKEFN